MSRAAPPSATSNQRLEIVAAWSLTALCVLGLIVLAFYFIYRGGDEKGTLIGTAATGFITLGQIGFNRIGQISQSRAMQKMADALHASAPVPNTPSGGSSASEFNYESFPPDDKSDA